MTTITVQDSRKKTRTLTIKGMIKPSGLRVAKVTNDRGETYQVQVRPDGTGACTCESRKPCYHMKAVLAASLPTFEELTAYTIAEAMADANEAISAFVRQPVRCIGCGGTCGEGKSEMCRPDWCRWNGWVIRSAA